MSSRLLQQIDRRRRHLARKFTAAASAAERFAISQELGRLLDDRRSLVTGRSPASASGRGWSHSTATTA